MLRHSLRNKLIGAFLLPTLMIVLLYGIVAYNVARTELEAELGRRLIGVGQTLSSQLSGGIQAKQLERLDPTKQRVISRLRSRLDKVKTATGVRRVFLFDQQGNSLVDTRNKVAFGQRLYSLDADKLEVDKVWSRGASTTSILFQGEEGRRYKTGYVPIFVDKERKVVVAVIGVEASASYFALLNNFASGLIAMGALSVLMIVLVGWLFARRLTSPLNHLVDSAQRLAQGNMEAPVIELDANQEAPRGDELQFLAQSFEEMRQSIVSRDRQMQMMLSGIAHEVRNPLGGMELFCGLLREDLMDEEPTQATLDKIEKVQRIERELNYLDKVVNDFLDFARMKPLDIERFEASELTKELQNLLWGEMMEHDCEMTVVLEPETVELTVEREQLRRAMLNTLRNAYQASPDGGTITLSVIEQGTSRVIEIQDQGHGIDPEQLKEIFTPFYTTKEKGSGLGLALTQKTIEQHQGTMTIDSQPGQGTTVRFVLPFANHIEAPKTEIPEGWLG